MISQPAAGSAGPAAAPGSRAVRARGLRHHRRPGPQEAAARGLRPAPTAGCCRPTSRCSASPAATGATRTSPTSPARPPRRTPAPRGARRSGSGWPATIRFVPGSFDDDNAFDQLAARSTTSQGSHGIGGNAAFYLSIPPAMFPTVLKQMQRTGHGRQRRPDRWRRVVVEKPFGEDLALEPRAQRAGRLGVHAPRTSSASTTTWARRPSRTCWRCASPTRCSSRSGTPRTSTRCRSPWPRTSASAAGPAFYEKTGAARDVLQNHLLQLLALTAMEEPVEFSAEEIRTEKLKVLRAISLPDGPGDLRDPRPVRAGLAGRASGSRATGRRRASPTDSTTETFAAVRLGVETRRWAGVPFYLRTGKRLPRRVTEIALVFKQAPHLPFADTDTEELGNNQLVIRVQPDEGVTLKFGSKVPGQRDGGPRRRRWTSSTASSSPRPAPRPTSGCCSTCCSATRRSSRATPRWRRPGR